MEPETKHVVAIIVAIMIVLIGFWVTYLVVYPNYNVYSSRKEGEALLAHAQASKEVAVAEAKAKFESATFLAQAEVERAKGVAQANKIIGDSLRGNEEYLRYLWINGLENAKDGQVIYVPTEAGLPILEAGRLKR